MNTDHIFTNTKTGNFKCEFCGGEEAPPFMPAPIEVIIEAMDMFIATHKGCERPQSEAVMSEYIKGFDAGYDFVLNEIKLFIIEHGSDPRFVGPVEVLMERLTGKKNAADSGTPT